MNRVFGQLASFGPGQPFAGRMADRVAARDDARARSGRRRGSRTGRRTPVLHSCGAWMTALGRAGGAAGRTHAVRRLGTLAARTGRQSVASVTVRAGTCRARLTL